MTNPLNIKQTVKDWFSEFWENKVKTPIAKKTEELENQAIKKIEEYSGKAKEQANKPLGYYQKQDAFYRGLFLIAIALLIILWIVSGS